MKVLWRLGIDVTCRTNFESIDLELKFRSYEPNTGIALNLGGHG